MPARICLLEKPMALTVGECDRLIAAARRNKRVLTIGHEFRLSTQWGALKTIIDEGGIGTPLYANVSLFRFPYRPGSGSWRYHAGKVGSWTLEEPVHFFDSLMWYFEAWGDPASVLSFGSSKSRDAGMSDNFTSIIRWPGSLYARRHPDPGWFRASSHHGDRRHRWGDPYLVVRYHGPHPRTGFRDQGSTQRTRKPARF